MGGKSRKSGQVSKKLIDRLKKGMKSGSACNNKNKKSKTLPSLFDGDNNANK